MNDNRQRCGIGDNLGIPGFAVGLNGSVCKPSLGSIVSVKVYVPIIPAAAIKTSNIGFDAGKVEVSANGIPADGPQGGNRNIFVVYRDGISNVFCQRTAVSEV